MTPDTETFQPGHPIPRIGEVAIRVRYCECDPMGVAHHASYIPWLEIGRTELLRVSGVSYAMLEAAGIFLVITHLDVRYRQPVRYDDALCVVTTIAGGRGARINHTYEIWRTTPEAGKVALLTTASTTLACVGRDGNVRSLPDWLRADAAADA